MTRVAVLADIHSDPDALAAVLADMRAAGARKAWVAGDMFGYGYRPAETFALLVPVDTVTVAGNHDAWVAGMGTAPPGRIADAADANRAALAARYPGVLEWLARLPAIRTFGCDGWQVTMCHGTPADPLGGRYYPDDPEVYPWLPGPGEILVLGQTHYPLIRGTAATGLLVNPGSVGQPRDGDPRPSWALLDTDTGTADLRRPAVPAGVPA